MSVFSEGYETFIRVNGAAAGSDHGANYVNNIEAEIEKLTKAMNGPSRKIDKSSVDTVKGFAAEWWHGNTFNIDAAAKGAKNRASVPDDNGLVDICLNSGEEYSVKYYKFGDRSAAQQAKAGLSGDPYYLGQGRLIPTDQLKAAQDWLRRKISEESNGGRAEQVYRYQEALDKLTDRIKDSNGIESIPLTEAEAKELAKLAKDGGFDPAQWGLTTGELIKFEYIMNQAFKAGLSAALVSVVLKVAPEICGVICKLIKDGSISVEDFKHIGFAALQGGTEGFIRGTVAAAITTSCKAGLMGATLHGLNPSIIGAITAIAMNTIHNACLMSFGSIGRQEFANRCAQDLVVTVCSLGAGIAGSSIAAALFTPAAAVLGYMIGSFVGSVVGAFVYKGVYSCVMAFCVESGSTFFGLVEQNYELPAAVLQSIGARVFDYEKFEPKMFTPQGYVVKQFGYQRYEPVKINVTFLRRGVIGVGTVGFQ